jgi:catechol-2,3-dioxygenase
VKRARHDQQGIYGPRTRIDSLHESAGAVGQATPLAAEQQAGFRTTRRRYLIIRPERIGHVVIKVRNLERSRKFYTEVLDMDVMMEVPAIHECWTWT